MKAATIASEKNWWIVALVMGLFAFALYANTIGNDYAMDDELVTRNHPLTSKGVSAIPDIFTSYYFDNNIGNYYEYRPIVLTSFAIEHTIFGDNPHVSHSINTLLYGILCMVLFFAIRAFKPDVNYLFPALATMIFAAHPLHTEVVASIKNRDEMFSFLFGISSMLWALKYARQGKFKDYLLFLLFIVLSVMSKRSVLSYTVIIPLAACWFSQASVIRLITLSFPLMLLVMFFSPIYEDNINGFLAAAIIGFPLVLWSIKTWMLHGFKALATAFTTSIKGMLHADTVANGNEKQSEIEETGGLHWLSIIALLLLTGLALTAIYLDIRVLIFIGLGLLLLAAIFLKGANKSYPFLLILLVVGTALGAFQYKLPTYIIVGFLFHGLFLKSFPLPARIIALFSGFIISATFILTTHSHYVVDSFIDVVVMFFVVLVHSIIKYKRAIPALLLAIGTMKLILEPQYQIIWIMNYLGAVYLFSLPYLKRQTVLHAGAATFGIVATFALVVFPLHPANPIYENNLGAYYKQLPDPYGDGLKNATDIVPGAGREVDKVENPLVLEKSFATRLATSAKVMGYYAYLMVAPLQLRFYYGFNEITIVKISSPVAIVCLVSYVVLFFLAFWIYKRDAILSFSLIYLLIGLLFVSNLGVLLTGIVAERLVFGASLGYCLLVAWGLMKFFKIDHIGPVDLKKLKPVFVGSMIIVIGLYSVRTIVRNTNWKDKLTLYTHDANISPNSAKVQQLLGNEYLNMGIRDESRKAQYFAQAEIYLKKSLEIAPAFHSALLDLGHMYSLKEDCNNAIVYLERFIAVSPPPPLVIFHYAICLDYVGRYQEALHYYERYVNADPYYPAGYSNLSYLLFRLGNYEQALAVSKKATEMIPNSPDPFINVGNVYLELKMPLEALPYFEKAYTINPNDLNVVLQLWDIHTQVGDPKRGAIFREKAIQMGHKF